MAGGSGVAEALSVAPVRMYKASLSQSLVNLLLTVPSTVQTQPLRILHLRLAARYLLQRSPSTSDHMIPAALSSLFAQLMLAHAPSLPSEAQERLVLLLNQLVSLSSSGSSSISDQDVQRWISSFEGTLSHSSHRTLCSLTALLVIPCAKDLLDLFSSHLMSPHHHHMAASSDNEKMLRHGRVWVRLGALRLHLVSPRRGVDPAGKYRLMARHLAQDVIGSAIDVEVEVRRAFQTLPGGPEVSLKLCHVSNR